MMSLSGWIAALRRPFQVVAGDMSTSERLAFYLATPLAIGLVLGMFRAQFFTTLPLGSSLIIWLVGTFMLWIACELGTLALVAATASLPRLPNVFLLIGGAVLGKLATMPLRSDLILAVAGWVGIEVPVRGLVAGQPMAAQSLAVLLDAFVTPIALWTGTNYFFIYVLGIPRLSRSGVRSRRSDGPGTSAAAPQRVAGTEGPGPKEAVSTAGADEIGAAPSMVPSAGHTVASGGNVPPGILREVPGYAGEPVICLTSEGNYVSVHTEQRHWLVRYTFQRALDEFAAVEGYRVHRSYWVSRRAVAAIRRRGRSVELELANGLTVPVSRGNRDLVRQIQEDLRQQRSALRQPSLAGPGPRPSARAGTTT